MGRLLASMVAAGTSTIAGAAMPGDTPTAATGVWTPKFFAPEQCDLLAAVGERIIPGSSVAHCDRVIDLVMSVETADVREQLVQALRVFDKAGQVKFGRSFRELPATQQDAVVMAEGEHTGKDNAFAVVKEWMADAYWSSREGMHELGWNGQMAWDAYPACGMEVKS